MPKKKNYSLYDNLQDNEKQLVDIFAKKIFSQWLTNVDDAIKQLSWPIVEKILSAELDNHLWNNRYEHDIINTDNRNYRNWTSNKTVHSSIWDINIKIPRDRNWEFDPVILPKYSKDISWIDKKILAMYARWMSLSDIKSTLFDIYWCNVDESSISLIIQKISPYIQEWKERPLEECYPIIYFDAIHIKVHKDSRIKSIAVYIVMWYKIDWYKDILWIYILWDPESAKDWLKVFNDLKNRWVKRICIATMDNLKWISESLKSVFENIDIQKCIVHQIRNCLNNASRKDRKQLVKDMKSIYKAPTEEIWEKYLMEFIKKWESKYSLITKSWLNNRDELKTFFKYPDELRKIIYTSNPIEWFNRQVRKYTKNKCIFPNEDAVMRSVYLAMDLIIKKWNQPIHNWSQILNQLNIYFDWELEQYINL